MKILTIIQLLLQLVAFFARRAERSDIEKAVSDALLLAVKDRADAAVAAADRVGGMPDTSDDPLNRDNGGNRG